MRSVLELNKKGQIDYPIITWIVIVFGLLLLAPIILKVFNSIKTPMSSALGNVTGGGEIARDNFNTVMNTAVNFWDKVVIAAFILATILLLVSAFLIDTHPFWLILYIFISFMVIMFAPSIMGALDNIYNSSSFASESAALSFMNTLRTNFGIILMGIMVITGIIIYGKIAFMGGKKR
jgi:hypothetical protein